MKEFFELILKFVINPINIGIVIAFNLATLVLLLIGVIIPGDILIKYNLNAFFINHFSNILIAFLVSLFLFITQIVPLIFNKYQERKRRKIIEKQTQELLDDDTCWEILLEVYKGKGHPVRLPEKHQKVMLLRGKGMIVRTTDQIMGTSSDLINPRFPYVLQPWVEDYIKEKLDK